MNKSERTPPDTVVVTLEGALDLWQAADVRRVLLGAIDDARRVVVDLSRVTLADSAIAANLVEALQKARRAGADLSLAAVAPSVMRVFELARLDRLFRIHADVDAAVEEGAQRGI